MVYDHIYSLVKEGQSFFWIIEKLNIDAVKLKFRTFDSRNKTHVHVKITYDVFNTKSMMIQDSNSIRENFYTKQKEIFEMENVIVIYRNPKYDINFPYPEGTNPQLPYFFTYIDRLENYTLYEIDFGTMKKNIFVRQN